MNIDMLTVAIHAIMLKSYVYIYHIVQGWQRAPRCWRACFSAEVLNGSKLTKINLNGTISAVSISPASGLISFFGVFAQNLSSKQNMLLYQKRVNAFW
jgi:hypothetical protein